MWTMVRYESQIQPTMSRGPLRIHPNRWSGHLPCTEHKLPTYEEIGLSLREPFYDSTLLRRYHRQAEY